MSELIDPRQQGPDEAGFTEIVRLIGACEDAQWDGVDKLGDLGKDELAHKRFVRRRGEYKASTRSFGRQKTLPPICCIPVIAVKLFWGKDLMGPELYHPPALPQMDLWKEVVGSLATIDHLITMSEKLPDSPLDQKAITMMMRREVSKLAGALKEVRIFERTTDVKIA